MNKLLHSSETTFPVFIFFKMKNEKILFGVLFFAVQTRVSIISKEKIVMQVCNEEFNFANTNINVVMVGATNSGKSTTIGHLLYKNSERVNNNNNNTPFEENLLHDDVRHKYKEYFKNTIRTTTVQISTRKYNFAVTDTPGFEKYSKNLIRGATAADAAIFTFDISEKLDINLTRDQFIYTFALGINQLIICINKMESVNYSQQKFENFVNEIKIHLHKVGYKENESINFIPISAWTGENLTSQTTENLKWFNGNTLLESMNEITLPKRHHEKELRFLVLDIYNINECEEILAGVVLSGTINVNSSLCLGPVQGQERPLIKINSMEKFHRPIQQASAGDDIAICINIYYKIKRGAILTDHSHPPPIASSITAQIIILANIPGEIRNGYSPIIYIHGQTDNFRFDEIKQKISKKNSKNSPPEITPKYITKSDCAIVEMRPQIFGPLNVSIETFNRFSYLGRFILKDSGRIIGIGRVNNVITGKYTYSLKNRPAQVVKVNSEGFFTKPAMKNDIPMDLS